MEIVVKNSHIEVRGYNAGSHPEIEHTFSYYEPITHSYIPCGIYYDEETSILYLPRGIDIWWLESKLNETAIIDRECDKYKPVDNLKLITPPRENQKQALRFMVCAGEYEHNAAKSQLSLNLTTGKGKTYISIATIAYYQITTMLIMYSNFYIQQWVDRITQYTNLTTKDIKVIQGSPAINKLLKDKNPDKKIYLVTHSSLERYGTQYGWDKVGELFRHLGIGIKVYDEAHQNFDNICMIDFFTNTWKTFYLTASPARSSEEENFIYSMYFKNIPAIDLFDEENDPHTKYVAIKFNSNPTIFDVRECKNQYGLNRIKYMKYLVGKPEYYELLRIILNLAMKSDGKCLIYIGTNEAIRITYNWIRLHYPELYDDIGIFTTLVSAEEKYQAQNKKIILSTTKSAGAAVDIAGLKMTVVLNEPFKSQVICQQSIGRTRDDDTLYIECVDVGFKQIIKYYSYKQPVINKYCTSNSVIRLSREELSNRANSIIDARPHIQLVARNLVQRIGTYDQTL